MYWNESQDKFKSVMCRAVRHSLYKREGKGKNTCIRLCVCGASPGRVTGSLGVARAKRMATVLRKERNFSLNAFLLRNFYHASAV